MNLSYNILWFDDTDDFFDSLDFEPLKSEISLWGFTPDIKLVTSPDEFMTHSPFKKFDLIVVDYNLEEYDLHGEEFIEKIRGNDVYTEVIFYSANPASDLWNAIRKKELEGVFVANRGTVLNKIERVANQSVKKILDLANMRGIVMAEVGNIDLILESILTNGIEGLEESKRQTIFKKFHRDVVEQPKKQIEKLELFMKNPSAKDLVELCDSYKRWNNFERLAKQHPKLKNNNVGDYNNDVLKPRNFLAHGKPRAKGDGYVFDYKGKEYYFDEQKSLSLRAKIIEYKDKFTQIEEIVKSG